ncbi:MAG TPA: PilZ domain-containing protein [Candidatus Acidoferrales bacterium]|nr:PilZ domain-containing protein [Candidatus Acidoferrales bacterium]
MNPSREVDAKERRSTPRARISVPVTLRPVGNSETPEWKVVSINMSHLGMFFASSEDIPEGTKVEMRFEMPERITGKQESAWRCMGRVVRDGQPLGKYGVGVRFDYYELLSA